MGNLWMSSKLWEVEAKEDELPSHVAFLTRKYGEVQNGDHCWLVKNTGGGAITCKGRLGMPNKAEKRLIGA